MICRLTTQQSAHLRGVRPEDSDRRDAGGTRPNLRNQTEREGATTGLGQLSTKVLLASQDRDHGFESRTRF
jgi:hypothetical protein